eukprot:7499540-Pyramimonas_sp.AAC.1
MCIRDRLHVRTLLSSGRYILHGAHVLLKPAGVSSDLERPRVDHGNTIGGVEASMSLLCGDIRRQPPHREYTLGDRLCMPAIVCTPKPAQDWLWSM